jgi:hypothetical protein
VLKNLMGRPVTRRTDRSLARLAPLHGTSIGASGLSVERLNIPPDHPKLTTAWMRLT